MTAASAPHVLQRETFRTSRLLDFCSERELVKQILIWSTLKLIYPHCRTGGSATGLSAIDAWTKPLSMMAALCAQIRPNGRNRLRRGLRQISNDLCKLFVPFSQDHWSVL
jgi:hypothetical protein